MSRFIREEWKDLTPYTPGEQPKERLIKLNTNESPYPPSPTVAQLLSENPELLAEELRLYPDPTYQRIMTVLAKVFPSKVNGETTDRFFIGRGSDEVLATVFMAYAQGGRIYYPKISYSFYPVYARVYHSEVVEVPLRDDFTVDIRHYMNNDGTVLIANPNAPTGIALSSEEIEQILIANPDHVVVIDEAYVDFGAESAMALIDRYENLLVVQTLSKSRALAGLRFGFAVGNPLLIEDLSRLQFSRNPYPVDRLSERIAALSLLDAGYYSQTVAQIIRTRQRVRDELIRRGWECTDSKANFLFARPANPGREKTKRILAELRREKILVRYFDMPRLDTYLRITIGTDEEMDQFLEQLQRMEEIGYENGEHTSKDE